VLCVYHWGGVSCLLYDMCRVVLGLYDYGHHTFRCRISYCHCTIRPQVSTVVRFVNVTAMYSKVVRCILAMCCNHSLLTSTLITEEHVKERGASTSGWIKYD
jgi:hypothetical protein